MSSAAVGNVAAVRSRAVGLVLGAVADAVFADPARWHPVAGFGTAPPRWSGGGTPTAARQAWRTPPSSSRASSGLGVATEAATRRRPVAHAIATAVATWAVLGGTSLAAHGRALAAALDSLRSRADAAEPRRGPRAHPRALRTGPAVAGRGGEWPGQAPSRWPRTRQTPRSPRSSGAPWRACPACSATARSTRSTRWSVTARRATRRFGWAAARADDVVNLVPSRVTALLTAGLAPAVGGSPRAASPAWRRDARAHPSPNAGPVEAATAGALGVGLGGPTVYAHGIENRPRLGSGPPPTPSDLRRAARLSRLVAAAATVLAVRGRRPRRSAPTGSRAPYRETIGPTRRPRGARVVPSAARRPARPAAPTQPLLPRHRHARRLTPADPDLGHHGR